MKIDSQKVRAASICSHLHSSSWTYHLILSRLSLQRLLGPQTGFFSLALEAHEACYTDFLPESLLAQLFAWLRKAFCPPEGIAISFMGQFIVSRERLRSLDLSTYQDMLVWLFPSTCSLAEDMRAKIVEGLSRRKLESLHLVPRTSKILFMGSAYDGVSAFIG